MATSVDFLPAEYARLSASPNGPSNEQLMLRLRADVGSSETLTPELASTAWQIGRVLVDREVIRLDDSFAVQDLLHGSLELSQPAETVIDPSQGSFVASYEPKERRFNLATGHVDNTVRLVGKNFTTLRDPADARLFALLAYATHESGHGLLSGVDTTHLRRFAPHQYAWYDGSIYLGLADYLYRHPEQGVLGDWHTDLDITAERFCEGYKHLAVVLGAEALGYSRLEANYLDLVLGLEADPTGKRGHNQIDYLYGDNGRYQLTKEEEAALWEVRGRLGYSLPMTPQEVVECLVSMHNFFVATSGLEPLPADFTDEQWAADVEEHRGEHIKAHVRRLSQKRIAHLDKMARNHQVDKRRG